MTKRFTAFLAAAAMLLCSAALPACAEEAPAEPSYEAPVDAEPMPPSEEYVQADGLQFTIYTPNPYYSTSDEQYAAVSGVDGSAKSVTIPAEINGVPVIDILYGTLCSWSLQEILVAEDQENFTSIDGVLFDAEGMTLLAYPLGKTGTYAVPEGTTEIGYSAFAAPEDYDRLTEITFPDSLRSIQTDAFKNQCGLTELVLPEGFEHLRDSCLRNCKNLKTLHLSKALRTFFRACSGCTSLCELTGEPTYFYIMDNVLFDKSNYLVLYPAGLTAEKYVMPNNVPVIEEGAFENNAYLKEVEIPGSTCAVKNTFYNMAALETLTFPEGVGTIKDVCVNCPSLKTVYFPKTLDFVGYGAFRDSKALTDIYYNGRIDQYEKISNVLTNRHIHRDGVTVHYLAEEPYELFFDGDEEIGGFTYKLYEDRAVVAGYKAGTAVPVQPTIRIVVAPEVKGLPVTTVGRRAFEHLANVDTIELPKSIRKIEPYAFQSAMVQVVIPDGVESIGEHAFYGSLITAIHIPESVQTIGKYAFANTKLTEVTLPEGLTDTGEGAFMNCKRLESVHLPSTLDKIGNKAFNGDESLECIELPDGIELIGGQAFSGTPLRKINLPDTITEIGDEAFRGCAKLRHITLPQNLNHLSCGVFENSSIEEITVPASVKYIDSAALRNCGELRRVTILNPECKIYNSDDVICSAVLWNLTDDPVPCAEPAYAISPLAGNDPVPPDEDRPTILYGFTMVGYEHSTAQIFADYYHIPFEIYDPDAYDIVDAVSLQRFLVGAGASGGYRNYDLNGDGETDVFDLALLKQKLTEK